MNAVSVLNLVVGLYEQILALSSENAELKQRLEESSKEE